MYRDFNGLMYIRTLRGKRGKCCLFDCLPKKNIEGSCLNVFNTERGFQIPNNWNDRIKAKIKTHHCYYGLGLAPPLSCLLRGPCNQLTVSISYSFVMLAIIPVFFFFLSKSFLRLHTKQKLRKKEREKTHTYTPAGALNSTFDSR